MPHPTAIGSRDRTVRQVTPVWIPLSYVLSLDVRRTGKLEGE